MGLCRVDLAQTARDHDGLVVATLHAIDHLLVFAKVTAQAGAAKLVVESRAAQRPLGHDLQRAGHVLGFAAGLVAQAAPEFGHGEARHARLGFGAPAGRAFVADLAACAGRCTRKGRNGGRVVVRFHLHQHMVLGAFFDVSRTLRAGAGDKAL